MTKMKLAATILMLAATCFAQRGTLVTKPVTSSLALPSALVSAPVKLSLTWDIQPGVYAWRVQVGPSRGNWTGSFITLTNRFVLTNGQHYAVRSIAGAMESSGAFWPSNRVGEFWLTDMTTNLVLLKRFTNAPPEPQRFWGVVNKTVGWE